MRQREVKTQKASPPHVDGRKDKALEEGSGREKNT